MSNLHARHISQLTQQTVAVVLAGGKGVRLHELTTYRAKPALYFGGKFRLIDFTLSNCINSGIRRIGVLTQYRAHSLMRHIMRGWSHFNRELGEFVDLLPASQQRSDAWYAGTTDAFFQNLKFLHDNAPEYVLVLSGDLVYKLDYGALLAQHVENNAELTLVCTEVPISEARHQYGVVEVDDAGRIHCFTEKPAEPEPLAHDNNRCLVSMGIYLFSTEFLRTCLDKDANNPASEHDFAKDLLPASPHSGKVYAFRFDQLKEEEAYWRDVGTIDSFWQANMELIAPLPKLNLYDKDWPIWTYQQQLPPAKFVFNDDLRKGFAVDSMISSGCIISGSKVNHSLLFNGVHVHSFAEVKDSLLLPQVEIGRNCRLRKVIIDAGTTVPEGFHIGLDHAKDEARGFRVSEDGVVLVTAEMLSACTN